MTSKFTFLIIVIPTTYSIKGRVGQDGVQFFCGLYHRKRKKKRYYFTKFNLVFFRQSKTKPNKSKSQDARVLRPVCRVGIDMNYSN